MTEPADEELRQACDRIISGGEVGADRWTYRIDREDSRQIARSLLSRLDREAEAERLLKLAREGIERAPHGIFCGSHNPCGYVTCDCWKSRALAGIAPAAPEGEKP